MKVAVIDEDQRHSRVVQQALELEGYDVIVADNGAVAMDAIRNDPPDLILCSFKVPGLSGDQLFDQLRRSDSELAVIPFIFMSDDASQEDCILRLNRGADNCLQKPIEVALLVAYVNAQLAGFYRVSSFVRTKLDSIAETLPDAVNHEFDRYKSLLSNASLYVDAIVATIQKSLHARGNPSMKTVQLSSSSIEQTYFHRLDYVQLCLRELENRRELAASVNGEDLTWQLIFLVAKAQLEGGTIPVSDLYVSVPSAKSTVIGRIQRLIDDDVFQKINDPADGRRQLILLSDRFLEAFLSHIDDGIELIHKVSSTVSTQRQVAN